MIKMNLNHHTKVLFVFQTVINKSSVRYYLKRQSILILFHFNLIHFILFYYFLFYTRGLHNPFCLVPGSVVFRQIIYSCGSHFPSHPPPGVKGVDIIPSCLTLLTPTRLPVEFSDVTRVRVELDYNLLPPSGPYPSSPMGPLTSRTCETYSPSR